MNTNTINKNKNGVMMGLLAVCVLGTAGAGWLALMLAGAMGFAPIIDVPFMPSHAVAAVIWSIFFALFGGSLFLIITAKTYTSAAKTVRAWAIGLWIGTVIMLLVWTLFMYRLQGFILAFVWLSVTASTLSALIVLAFRLRPAAAFMLLPIAVWLLYLLSSTLYLVVNV